MLTRKQYKTIAEIVKTHINFVKAFQRHRMVENACKNIACDLANYFIQDDPQFNRQKFLTACGI